MSRKQKSRITTNMVTCRPNWPEVSARHTFFSVVLSDDKDYDTQCARIRKAAGSGFQVMLQKTEKDNTTFFVMMSKNSEAPVSGNGIEFSPLRPSGFTAAFPTSAFLNIMLRFAFLQNPFTIGAGADDGKVYLICEKKTNLIHTGAPMFFDEETAWGPKTFLSVQSRSFKTYENLTEEERMDEKTRRVRFFQRGTIMSSRKGGDDTPYLMGNFKKQRHTISAYGHRGKSVSGDIRAFMSSRSGIITQSLDLLRTWCPYVNVSLNDFEGETTRITETDMKKRMAFVAQRFPQIRVHDPLQTQQSRNTLYAIITGFAKIKEELKKAKVNVSFEVIEAPAETCHFYLVHDAERYEEGGDLHGQEDAYHHKPLTAQALNADYEGGFSSRTVRGEVKDQEEKTQRVMLHTMLNELLIKAEVSFRQMALLPGEVLPEFRAFAGLDTLNTENIPLPAEWEQGNFGVQATFSSNGDLTFDIVEDIYDVVGGILRPKELAIEVGGSVVIIKRSERGWTLPNVNHISAAYKDFPDGGNPDMEFLDPNVYDAAIAEAGLDAEEHFRLRPEMSRTAILGMLSAFLKEKDISDHEKERRTKAVKSVRKILEPNLVVEGVRTNAALGGLLGVFRNDEGTMFSSGLPKGPSDDVVRFPVLYSMQTLEGEPVPEAFFELLAAHNQRHMRIDSKIFVFKHMKEFLKMQLSGIRE